MKIRTEHYDALRRALDEGVPRVPALSEYEASGMTAKRWRWDALWQSRVLREGPLCSELYRYLDDSHIDTALRHITGTK